MRTLALFASCALGPLVGAQNDQVFELYSGLTNFTTRAALPGSSPGDICQQFPGAHIGCMGQYALPGTTRHVYRLSGIRVVIQDQYPATLETFSLALIANDPVVPHLPDGNPGRGDLIRVAALTIPTSTSTSPTAWFFTTTLATPFDSVPAGLDVYLACGVPANRAWSSDGLNLHQSGWSTLPTDNPYAPVVLPPFVYTIDRSGVTPLIASNGNRFLRLAWLCPLIELRIGADIDPAFQVCPNPNFGAAGFFPNFNPSRLDGLAFRVTDVNHVGAPFLVFGGTWPLGVFPLPPGSGIVGDLSFDPNTILNVTFAAGTLAPGGNLVRTFPFPNGWRRGIGSFSFQAVVLDTVNGLALLSNGFHLVSR